MLKRKDVLIILILTSITVAAWIGFNIYHIVVTSTINEELQMQITEINPNFDTNTISKLKTREQIVPLYQFNASADSENNASNAADINLAPAENTATVTPEMTLVPQASIVP